MNLGKLSPSSPPSKTRHEAARGGEGVTGLMDTTGRADPSMLKKYGKLMQGKE